MDYIKRFIEKHRYGPWKEILIGYAVVCLISGAVSAWNSRHFLSSFALWSITNALYFPVIFACFGLSIWAGVLTAKISRLQTVGWIAGVAAFFFIGWALPYMVSHIPGIGWRLLAIQSASLDDY